MKQKNIFVLALDHRNSLRRLLNPNNPERVGDKEIIDWKKTALKGLLKPVSHVLVDPGVGLPALKDVGKGNKKLVLSIEKSGYTDQQGERLTELKYQVKELLELGADVIKLLVYYHPCAATASQQRRLVQKVAAECAKEGVDFLIEPKPYQLDEDEYDEPELVLQTARDLANLDIPISIYKTPYPGQGNCAEFDRVLNCPWVLLSGGDTFEIYREKLEDAVRHGCSGFAAGRALWQDFVKYSPEEWPDFFQTTARRRLEEIIQLVRKIS